MVTRLSREEFINSNSRICDEGDGFMVFQQGDFGVELIAWSDGCYGEDDEFEEGLTQAHCGIAFEMPVLCRHEDFFSDITESYEYGTTPQYLYLCKETGRSEAEMALEYADDMDILTGDSINEMLASAKTEYFILC